MLKQIIKVITLAIFIGSTLAIRLEFTWVRLAAVYRLAILVNGIFPAVFCLDGDVMCFGFRHRLALADKQCYRVVLDSVLGDILAGFDCS